MRGFSLGTFALASIFTASAGFMPQPLHAADHRDAPVVDGAGEGDITDVYAFLDPNNRTRIVFIMGVNPFEIPALRHSYRFSTGFLYQFKIDINGDYKEDYTIQVTFKDTAAGQQFHVRIGPVDPAATGALNTILVDAPINVTGPLDSVVNSNNVQVFAGQRDDPFVLDAQFFRILSSSADVFRDIPTSPLGPLRGRKVGANGQSGIDSFAGGLNASFIAVSVPVDTVSPGFFMNRKVIYNLWGTVSAPYLDDSYIQFERAGQPLFNTVFIPGAMKDAFNSGVPADDVLRWSSFVPDALTNTDNDGTGNTIAGRAGLLTSLGLAALPFGAPLLLPADFKNPDKDLLRVALLPDVLRLNLDADVNDLGIGVFGLTNGRRLGDDVVDIALRVLRQLADVNFPAALGVPGSGKARASALTFPDRRIFAVLQGSDFVGPDSAINDLANSNNDSPLLKEFPFLAPARPRPGDELQ